MIVNEYWKDDNLFNINNPTVKKWYGSRPSVLFRRIDFTACTNLTQENNKNDVAIFLDTDVYGSINYCKHRYLDRNKSGLMVYDLFFKWASLSYEKREQTKDAMNKQLLTMKSDWSTVPKNESDWYFENEASTKEPIMVSNAHHVTSYSIIPNRTIALTLGDVKKLYNIINTYFNKQKNKGKI
jgi:hypothetical protein